MPKIVWDEVIDPKTLSEAELDALSDRLYAVHNEIFDGLSRGDFARYVVRSQAEHTRIQVSYGPGDELAGYIAMHSFRRSFRGEPCTVLRAEAGLRRAYRGDGGPGAFFAKELVKARLEQTGALYYLGCLVHPSSYTALAHGSQVIWPAPGAATPEDIQTFMLSLGDEFHLPRVDAERPLVREVGWITRDSEVEREYWLNCQITAPRFFVEQNPGFVQGHGLLTLMPLDFNNLGRSLVSWGSGRVQRSLRRSIEALERTLFRPNVANEQAETVLQHIERVTGLSLEALRALRGVGVRYPVAARTVLFSAGERGDALYFIVQGSLVVLERDDDGQELIIDQLGPGFMVGEMAVLTGRPRTATVRAATDAVLVRLTRADLDTILKAEPRIEEALWRFMGRRVLDERARYVPGLDALSHQERLAWADSGESLALAPDQELSLHTDRLLVLIDGHVITDGPSGWASVNAPAALTLSPSTTITAMDKARLMLLPPTPA
jgi:CRP-like cAMP-binding protein